MHQPVCLKPVARALFEIISRLLTEYVNSIALLNEQSFVRCARNILLVLIGVVKVVVALNCAPTNAYFVDLCTSYRMLDALV